MSWVILAFGSVFFFTTLALLQRVLAIESKNPRAMAVLFNILAALIALLIFFLTGSFKRFVLPTGYKAWAVLLGASFCYGIYARGQFLVAKLLDASVLTTVRNISVLVAFVGSLFLYSETLTAQKILGGALIIVALFLVSVRNNPKNAPKEGLLLGIGLSIMLGLAWMLDKLGTQFFTANTYNILIWTVPIIFIFLPKMGFSAIKKELEIASWRVFVLAGVNVFGFLMQLKALETAEATKVIPIVQTSTLFTILFAVVLLDEKDYIYRKAIASLLAVAGTYFLI